MTTQMHRNLQVTKRGEWVCNKRKLLNAGISGYTIGNTPMKTEIKESSGPFVPVDECKLLSP